MNRRRVLIAGASIVVVGGGVAGYRATQCPPTPGPVTNVEFTAREERSPLPNSPKIDVRPSENRIIVSGAFIVGNECDAATIDTIEYDESRGELRVAVTGESARRPWQFRCSDIEQVNGYELDLAVDSIPSRITAIERGAFDDHRTSVEPEP